MYIKQPIDVIEHLSDIFTCLQKGILLTTKKDDKVNTMTISWGQVGIEWGKLLFTVFVRTGRLTREILDDTAVFTINLNPVGKNTKITSFCGTKSGRDIDKIKELGLTTVRGNVIDVPGFLEMPLTLECKILYSRTQDEKIIPNDISGKFYPQDVGSECPSDNKDFHRVYMAEIVDAYIIRQQ